MSTETVTATNTNGLTAHQSAPASVAPLEVKKKQKTLVDFLQDYKGQMQMALPKHISVDRMLRITMSEIRRVPKLKECTPASFIGSVMQCCQLGLEPGTLGQAYLLPYKNSKLSKEAGHDVYECQFILGYKGMIDLARRSGHISNISPRIVRESDQFDFCFGLIEKCDHKPIFVKGSPVTGVYAVVRFKDGSHQFDYMPAEEINVIRDKTANYSWWIKDGRKEWNKPIWEEYYDEMAKKTVLRRMFKYLPISIELQNALALDEAADRGEQSNFIIEGQLDSPALEALQSKSDELANKLGG